MFQLTVADDKLKQDPEVQKWLRECEEKISDHVVSQMADYAAYGYIELPAQQ